MILLARLWCGYIPLTCRQPLPLAAWAFLEDIGQKVSGVSPNAFEYFLNRSNIGYFKHDGTMTLIFGSLCLRDFTGSSKVSRGKANTFLWPIKKGRKGNEEHGQWVWWQCRMCPRPHLSPTCPLFERLWCYHIMKLVAIRTKKSAFTISSPCIYDASYFPKNSTLLRPEAFQLGQLLQPQAPAAIPRPDRCPRAAASSSSAARPAGRPPMAPAAAGSA